MFKKIFILLVVGSNLGNFFLACDNIKKSRYLGDPLAGPYGAGPYGARAYEQAFAVSI